MIDRAPAAGSNETLAKIYERRTARLAQSTRRGAAGAGRPADAVSKQTAAQIQRTTALVQLTLDHFALTNRGLAAMLAEIGLLRQQQIEFLETQPSCVMTDAAGVIHEANTPGLLLLGASVRDLGT